MNQYVLKRYSIGKHVSLPLEKSEYDQILSSKRRLLEHLAIEELFDVMMGNYEEFERELLAITLKDATYFDANARWTDSIDIIQLAARRVANLLTTTHGYCDQVPHAVSTIFGETSAEVTQAKSYFRHEYDSTKAYRVCTELRRYMQHRGTAVHGFNAASSWVDRPDGRRVRAYMFAPQVNVRRLSEDPKFKKRVLAELQDGGTISQSTGDRVHDLRPFIREYVSALGRIHMKVRELLAPDAAIHDGIISKAIDRYSELPDAKGLLGLAAMELSEKGMLEDRFPTFVMKEPTERRAQLVRRNHLPAHFDTMVITNECELS
jgi:hypothetical protein